MPATAPLQPPHPVLAVRSAVIWARAEGHRIRLGTFGVHCVSGFGNRWAPDHDGGIDPVGAAILAAQPDCDDPFAAAAEAMSAPESWVAGFVSGLNREGIAEVWERDIHRRLVAAGFEAGSKFRAEFCRHLAPRGNA